MRDERAFVWVTSEGKNLIDNVVLDLMWREGVVVGGMQMSVLWEF